MDQSLGSGSLVQIVDVLGDDQNVAGIVPLELGERMMSRVRLCLEQALPPRIVELVHEHRIAGEATSERSYLVHSPSSPRNVPSPLSAESPAPVRMTMFR
jgi:hypothetical protein